ncbi:hypothetical protein [Halopenitus sp. POP-27]|uniref:DUF7260 family protein n=1 Tax=Halopenitus sp. POP-27 TaxID=2994425 RepID=UPI0024690DC7|nr:hypothetical protein [Halopenitus sp. POP-27]
MGSEAAGSTADGVQTRLATLRRTVRAERRRVVDERQAFDVFRKRLAEIDPRETTRTSAPTHLVGDAGTSAATPGLCAVRDAYEETVMSVPHYAADYDDTYPESLAAEFGRELSVTLTTGTAFDPAIKRELGRIAGVRRDRRADLLDTLDAEATSLDELGTRLPELARDVDDLVNVDVDGIGFGALEAYHARAGTLRDRCEAVAQGRQAAIRRQRRDLRVPGETRDVPRYLYVDCEATYPVLAMIADLTDRAASFQSRVETAIAEW